jgi:hypothetical protein
MPWMPRELSTLWVGLSLIFFVIPASGQTSTAKATESELNSRLPDAGTSPYPSTTTPSVFDRLALLLSREIREIDGRRQEIYEESLTLPPLPRGQQGSRVGYHSLPSAMTNETKWIKLDLGRPAAIDSIVLIPAEVPFALSSRPGYGFPSRFLVEAADNAAFEGAVVISDNTQRDFPNPGGYPVQFPTPGTIAQHIRIKATGLWQREGQGILALGELMVLSGPLNIAAGLPPEAVQVSDSREVFPAWSKAGLIDGQSVLGAPLMGPPSLSNGFHSQPTPWPDTPKWVQVDLGKEYDLQEIRVYPARPRASTEPSPFGFPWDLRVEISKDPEFKERQLVSYVLRPAPNRPTASPVTIRAEGHRGRFVRVTATRLARIGAPFALVLSELQVFSDGENVAEGTPVTASGQSTMRR